MSRLSDDLKKRRIRHRDMEGKPVRILRRIVSNGGDVFEANDIGVVSGATVGRFHITVPGRGYIRMIRKTDIDYAEEPSDG